MNNYMLLIASIIVCCSLIALLENETVSLVEVFKSKRRFSNAMELP